MVDNFIFFVRAILQFLDRALYKKWVFVIPRFALGMRNGMKISLIFFHIDDEIEKLK